MHWRESVGERWQLSSITISVTTKTESIGSVRVGLIAQIIGVMSEDRHLMAQRILVRHGEVEYRESSFVQFTGTIESVPANRVGIRVIGGSKSL